MLHILKTTNLLNTRMAFIGCLLAVVVLALLPISAEAQCSTGWDASGSMKIRQRGIRLGFTFDMQQKGRVITGKAVGAIRNRNNEVDVLEGSIDGTLDGDSFNAQVFWTNGSRGIYNAKVLPSGRLDGEGYEKNSPNVRVPWYSDEVLKCPAPAFKAPTWGKFPKVPGTAKPTSTPAPPPKPPFIIASQPIGMPNLPYSSVFLGWDGGPDHTSVEVWLSINNSPEIPAFSMDIPAQSPVFKQPKGPAIELRLERGRHYKFVLKASGKTLSTAAFVVP